MDVMDLCRVMEISPESFYRQLIRYSLHCLPTEHRVPEDPARLPSLPIEQMRHLEVPVPAFQVTKLYNIYCTRCTGNQLLRNLESRNDWVSVQAGGEGIFGALRGHLLAKLMVLFKIWDYISESSITSAKIYFTSDALAPRPDVSDAIPCVPCVPRILT